MGNTERTHRDASTEPGGRPWHRRALENDPLRMTVLSLAAAVVAIGLSVLLIASPLGDALGVGEARRTSWMTGLMTLCLMWSIYSVLDAAVLHRWLGRRSSRDLHTLLRTHSRGPKESADPGGWRALMLGRVEHAGQHGHLLDDGDARGGHLHVDARGPVRADHALPRGGHGPGILDEHRAGPGAALRPPGRPARSGEVSAGGRVLRSPRCASAAPAPRCSRTTCPCP